MKRARFSFLKNFSLPAAGLNAIAALLLASLYNFPMWRFVMRLYPVWEMKSALFLGSGLMVLWSLFYACLTLFSFPALHKKFLGLIFLLNAVILYYMHGFGIVIDATMLENVWQTDPAEALETLHWKLGLWLLVLGVLPALVVSRLQIRYPAGKKHWLLFIATLLVPLCLSGAVAATQFQSFASLLRNHKEMRYLILPNNYIYAAVKTVKKHLPHPAAVPVTAQPAQKDASWTAHKRPTLFVMVVGETARAANFSIDGYERDTTPRLSRLLSEGEIINFQDMRSCGTNTAVSLPCMFSPGGRAALAHAPPEEPNNLFRLLARAGLAPLWIDNNSGCKGICEGLPEIAPDELAQKFRLPEDKEETHDMSMLPALQQFLAGQKGDAFVVLHQKGSHGPAYYQRIPENFQSFQPVCRTQELQKCSRDELRNSFDNTILYTDHFLAELIALLKTREADSNVAMLYVSDHGESLGEHGLYLHGLPYAIAPDEQKHVPFILYLSEPFLQEYRLDKACISKQATGPWTHDNLFHSILDVLHIQTPQANRALSLFKDCVRK